MKKLCALIFAAFALVPCSRAWNAEGHMVVAQIAYNHLTPSVKAICDGLIAVPILYTNTGTTNFITAACWADDFKTQLGTGIWHYIDIPFSLDGTPTTGVSQDSYDVVRAINLCVQQLANPSTTQSNQAIYLRYLIHFVGDIQQPLHASTAVFATAPSGDAGGNGFVITGYGGELHALWDQGGGFISASVGRPLSASGKTTLSNKVAAIEADYPYTSNAGVYPNPMDWATEGWNLAQTVAYVGISQGDSPSSSYTNAAQHTAESRLALGGHRLADLLNTIYTESSTTTLQVNAASSGNVSFSWNAVPGHSYHVQRKQDFAESWADVAVVTSKSGLATYSEPVGTTMRFYRVTQ
ncbi:MAG: S1/P1 nuclease [Limisphaerales bacterium]